MKNITVSVDDEIYRRSRIKPRRGRYVRVRAGEIIFGRAPDAEFERLKRQQQDVLARIRSEHPGFSAVERLSRDAAHDRDALR